MKRRGKRIDRRQRKAVQGLLRMLALCVMVLPLPMPSFHQHDGMESAEHLAAHVACWHESDDGQIVTADTAHWHFAMPGQPDEDNDAIPRRPANGIIAIGSVTVATSSAFASSMDDRGCPLMSTPAWFVLDLVRSDPRHCSAAAEVQRQRCALSCVLRC